MAELQNPLVDYCQQTRLAGQASLRQMIGEELRKSRQKAGLTQEDLAFAAGIDRTYVSQLENDKKSPTLDVFFRICGALKVRPSLLIAKVEKSVTGR